MDIKEGNIRKELVAFSDQTIEESSKSVDEYIQENPTNFKIDNISNKVEPVLLGTLSKILDQTIAQDVYIETTDEELDSINETLNSKTRNWEKGLKRVLEVTYLSKILQNRKYTTKNVTDDLLRKLLNENCTDDLSYIWLSSLRTRIIAEKDSIELL